MHLRNMEREPHYVIFNIAPLWGAAARWTCPENFRHVLESSNLELVRQQSPKSRGTWGFEPKSLSLIGLGPDFRP